MSTCVVWWNDWSQKHLLIIIRIWKEFEQKHADFIRQVRDSFQDISRHYRVALPVSEIAYIYDYMHLNSKISFPGRQKARPSVRTNRR